MNSADSIPGECLEKSKWCPKWTATIIRRLSITNGCFATVWFIKCLHHNIERQNLMRDVKIDQMLFCKDWLPYSACIACYECQTQNEREKRCQYMTHERIHGVYEPLNPHKRIKSYWVRSSSCGGWCCRWKQTARIETSFLSINWGGFFFHFYTLFFSHCFFGSMVFFSSVILFIQWKIALLCQVNLACC